MLPLSEGYGHAPGSLLWLRPGIDHPDPDPGTKCLADHGELDRTWHTVRVAYGGRYVVRDRRAAGTDRAWSECHAGHAGELVRMGAVDRCRVSALAWHPPMVRAAGRSDTHAATAALGARHCT